MRIFACICLAFAIAIAGPLGAAEDAEPPAPPSKTEVRTLIDGGVRWLREQQQADGSFMRGQQFKLGVTEMTLLALLEAGVATDDPAVAAGVDYVLAHRQPDGSIYAPEEGLQNYCTALGLRLLVRVGADEEVIATTRKALLGFQDGDEDSPGYGGFTYGGGERNDSDLSNTLGTLQALREAGLPADHPALERAERFVQRCQNLSSHNDLDWPKQAGSDGGAIYQPASPEQGSFRNGHAEEGEEEPAAPRSYGTMTYALISSYLHLDLEADDPRLQAALDWARRNYQFAANPGLAAERGNEGLFYYYLLLAKTWDLQGSHTFTTLGENPRTVDWRADLFHAIADRAKPAKDGGRYWINSARRWGEGIPVLTTAYMVAALAKIETNLGDGE